jgi:hypothetical protein
MRHDQHDRPRKRLGEIIHAQVSQREARKAQHATEVHAHHDAEKRVANEIEGEAQRFKTPKRNAFPKRRRRNAYTTDKADRKAQLAADLAAYEARVAAQVYPPVPPTRHLNLPETRSIGARELATEIRKGHYKPR